MAKWIELNNGWLVNLDNVSNINKYQTKQWDKNVYTIVFCYDYDSDCGYAEEAYENEEERNKRFEEIKAMLIGSNEE